MLRLQTILFTTDGSDCAESARPLAERLADESGATLHMLRVEIVAGGGIRFPALDPPPDVVTGRTVEATRLFSSAEYPILAYVDEIGADLVVMGTNARSGFGRAVLGSTAEAVLRRAACPVLTVGSGAAVRGAGPVLVPVAFESGSDTALETGAAFAEAWSAPLMALHVVEPFDLPMPYMMTAATLDRTADVEAARATLGRWAEAHASGDVETRVEEGYVATCITGLADQAGAQLVVQASHGRRGVGRWLLGSVAEEVVRTAPCPVLTLRPNARPIAVRAGSPLGVALPRPEWPSFFDALSKRIREAPHTVSVDVVWPGAVTALYDAAPLVGLTYSPHAHALEVLTGTGGHTVERPFAVRTTITQPDDPAPWRIDVVRSDGTRERITVSEGRA